MLAEIASQELTDIVSSSPENRSEIDPSQNEKKGTVFFTFMTKIVEKKWLD